MKRKKFFSLLGLSSVLALLVNYENIGQGKEAMGGSPQLTIYNQNFAVVKEIRQIDLPSGESEFRAEDISSQLDPSSIILRDLKDPDGLKILEQNYENDPLSQGMLLHKFEGKEITLEVMEPDGKTRALKKVKIIRSGYTPGNYSAGSTPIIEMDGKIRFGLPGTPLFDSISSDSFLKPTLLWKLWSKQGGKRTVEFSYLTSGLSWEASYNAVFPEQGNELDLIGWVTIRNQTGKDFENASLKFLAGDVHRIQEAYPQYAKSRLYAMAKEEAVPPPPVTERSFEEYHMYDLNRATTLHNNQVKQIEFVRGMKVPVQKIYVYDGASVYRWDYTGTSSNKVWYMLEFKNNQESRLGMPLPKGKVKVYRRDLDGRNEFIGEDMIDHTPKDEMVKLYLGNAFDIVGNRKQTNFSEEHHSADESFEISLRNHKKETVEVRVIEHLYRWSNWKITQKSDDFEKTDSATIQFKIKIKPDEERKVSYTVHYWW